MPLRACSGKSFQDRASLTLRGTPRDAQFLRAALPVTGRRLRPEPHPFLERTVCSPEEERSLALEAFLRVLFLETLGNGAPLKVQSEKPWRRASARRTAKSFISYWRQKWLSAPLLPPRIFISLI
jgi:hypothetical protein